MSIYVFFNVAAYGHFNPTLPIVAKLSRRGHKVYYFTGTPLLTLYRRPVAFRSSYRSFAQSIYQAAGGQRDCAFAFLMALELPHILPVIADRLKRLAPDCIGFNTLLLAPGLAAWILGLRTTGFGIYYSPGQQQRSIEILTDLNIKLYILHNKHWRRC